MAQSSDDQNMEDATAGADTNDAPTENFSEPQRLRLVRLIPDECLQILTIA